MTELCERERLTRVGSIWGIAGNAFLAIFKIGIGFFSGSLAIIADGIDSATDIVTSFLTFIASKISNRPADAGHPFGHEKIETIITKVMSVIILFAGYNVFHSAYEKLKNPEEIAHPSWVLAICIVSIIIKFVLYKYKYAIGKKINSPSFIADALNLRNDILTSAGVLIGMIVYVTTKINWIDPVLAMLVSLFIFKIGFSIFFETSKELMDSSTEMGDLYKEIVKSLKIFQEVKNPHKIRIRKAGFVYFLELHLEVKPEMTVAKAHKLTEEIEQAIKESISGMKEIIIHIEPFGNQEEEGFGFDTDTIQEYFQKDKVKSSNI